MNDFDDLKKLFHDEALLRPDEDARAAAIAAAMVHAEKTSGISQESGSMARLRNRMANIWNRRTHMRSFNLNHTLMAGASLAVLTLLVVANPALHQLMKATGVATPPAVPANQPVSEPPGTVAELQPKDEASADRAVASRVESKGKDVLKSAILSDGLAAAGNIASSVGIAEVYAPPPPSAQESRDRFTDITSNPVKQVATDPLSTFSIDVDTSSYSFIRRALLDNVLPPKDAVRIEEMVNYFPYDYAGPADRAEPFKANVSLMQTPWNADTKLMRIGIKGFSLDGLTKPHSNLVFLIDTSGSMDEPDKLPLLLNSFRLLLDTLGPDDTVSIVTYAGSAGTVLEPTKASEKAKILAALDGLSAGGSTAGAQGIRQAYNLAEQHFDKAGVNRVILATDGDFNVGISDPRELQDFVERKRQSGVYLSVLGFGQGNYNDELMQALAQNGNGNAGYIDSLSEARKVLVDEATSTLFPIANDVKIQVEFNPAAVSEYRLIGYETRLLNKDDFNNDHVDAGDIGAGHTVTALYEVTPKGSKGQLVDPLRYGTAEQPGTPAGEYAFVKIRYKLPGENTSRLITESVTGVDEKPSAEANFAAAVAGFGQLLRGGEFTKSFGYDDVIALANASRGPDPYGYRAEFITLARLAKTARVLQ
ncbi:von Willebrand factor type A domain-containing protein [Aestuariivirga sp.]|uniref:vWA domain-containing protein n=1 Tax=Aestuariivirga sp. TaxID=2650926 RepID=UPI00301898D8